MQLQDCQYQFSVLFNILRNHTRHYSIPKTLFRPKSPRESKPPRKQVKNTAKMVSSPLRACGNISTSKVMSLKIDSHLLKKGNVLLFQRASLGIFL